MAERNWRDEFEEKDIGGYTVLDVWYTGGNARVYEREFNYQREISYAQGKLIPKTKPKTYRPWTQDEVPVGLVVKGKNTGFRAMIIGVSGSSDMIRVSDGCYTARAILEMFTMLDGTPCGVLES